MEDVEDLINSISAQNFAAANGKFEDIIGQRIGDALEAQKISVADQIFNGEHDYTDEELEAAAEEELESGDYDDELADYDDESYDYDE